jgi:sirohydrochlorin ferrochelatase
MRTALVVIAHGSRQREANEELVHLAAELSAAGGYERVEPAFLELAEPTITQAAQRCIAPGVERVVLVPYFLSAGVHVRRDLQRHRDELALQNPQVAVLLAEPLGPHPSLGAIVLERARRAIEDEGCTL